MADDMCYMQATAAGLAGMTFRAFLSDRFQGINYLAGTEYVKLPIANIKVSISP